MVTRSEAKMQITPVSTSGSTTSSAAGLSGTGAAIRSAQARFDESATKVVQDTMSTAAEAPAADTLANDLVAMKVDSLTNSILYGVFRRQSEQQQNLVDLSNPQRS